MKVAQQRRADARPGPPSASQNMTAKQQAMRGSKTSLTRVSETKRMIKLRAQRLTTCLFLLVGAISSLSPFLSLHLTNRVGLLLFESELLQLRSSLVTVMICLLFLLLLYLTIILMNQRRAPHRSRVISSKSGLKAVSQESWPLLLNVQRILKPLTGMFAILSLLSYLALPLIVPHIVQIQRAPMATFDCSANMITIENCQQQFVPLAAEDGDGSSSSLVAIIQQLIVGDLSGNNERLARRLECLKYNKQHYDDQIQVRASVPTRFLLHKCGLVCEPQRQHLHQFNDDLNANQQQQQQLERPLVAPYDEPHAMNSTVQSERASSEFKSIGGLVSLKLCFSGEINGASSNYRRYCIENLTNGPRSATLTSHNSSPFSSHQDGTLTVSQLNAILRMLQTPREQQQVASDYQNVIAGPASVVAPLLSPRVDQSTHYVNPIVQFESHFKNWPHLARANSFTEEEDQQQQQRQHSSDNFKRVNDNGWCKYKPVPPFIVNNKPFSEIQCSLEQDYLMSTRQQSTSRDASQAHASRSRRDEHPSSNRIYLRKFNQIERAADSSPPDRCNIQCKVDILYQVHSTSEPEANKAELAVGKLAASNKVYYLPIKSCVIVLGDGDKWRTSSFYLVIRSVADASLLLAFILVDILLLFESIDTQRFQLESNKRRLLSVLLAITVFPLLAAALFDLAASWAPIESAAHGSFRDGYLLKLVDEKLIPFMSDSFSQMIAYFQSPSRGRQVNARFTGEKATDNLDDLPTESNGTYRTKAPLEAPQELMLDHYLIPFLIYAFLMFALAINSFKLPLTGLKCPLSRMASTEELGLSADERQWMGAGQKAISQNELSGGSAAKRELERRSESLRGLDTRDGAAKSAPSPLISTLARDRKEKPMAAERIALFALLILFMGIQFNMSQLTQSQILLDSFSIQNDLNLQQQQQQQQQQHHQGQSQTQAHIHRLNERPNKVAIWFVLVANSSGTIFSLLLALVFSDELSVFMGEFCPFKPMPSSAAENEESRRCNAIRFRKYLSISLIVYALRYYVLANMSAGSRMRWPLLLLFQVTELMNFPLTWFVLTARAHELLTEGLAPSGHSKRPVAVCREEEEQQRAGSTIRLVNLHILIQSSLALVYFALGRFMALFIHACHASFYLHSDNLGWFISTFYAGSKQAVSKGAQEHKSHSARSSSNSSQEAAAGFGFQHSEALFAPLPSERQTYLHASRSFIKYNSLVCLLVGLVYLCLFASARYLQWRAAKKARRLVEAHQRRLAAGSRESDLICDEQISLDLRKLHANRVHESRQASLDQVAPATSLTHLPISSSHSLDERERPRARIHFRYNLASRRGSSSSSSTGPSLAARRQPAGVAFREQAARSEQPAENEVAQRGSSGSSSSELSSPSELRIPMVVEEEDVERGEDEGRESGGAGSSASGSIATSSHEQFVEIAHTRHKRVKRVELVNDDENWSLGTGSEGPEPPEQFKEVDRFEEAPFEMMATSPPPAGFGDSDDGGAPDDAPLSDTPNDHVQSSGREGIFPTNKFGPAANGQKRARLNTEAHVNSGPARQADRNNKRITFAPTATFIGQDGALSSWRRSPRAQGNPYGVDKLETRSVPQRRQRHIASPEPSIENFHVEQIRVNELSTIESERLSIYDGDSIDCDHR